MQLLLTTALLATAFVTTKRTTVRRGVSKPRVPPCAAQVLEWTAVSRPIAATSSGDTTPSWSCGANGNGGGGSGAAAAVLIGGGISLLIGVAYCGIYRRPAPPQPPGQHISYAMPITATRPMETGSPPTRRVVQPSLPGVEIESEIKGKPQSV